MTIHAFHFAEGKYTLQYDDDTAQVTALRYGEPWRDFVGDHLLHYIAVELVHQREVILGATNAWLALIEAGGHSRDAVNSLLLDHKSGWAAGDEAEGKDHA